ncbi:MAG: hypothetical protein LBQ52_10670, partial [Helicobacteraceae bacterium]|jgi:hypothetical protein|nr:hypothetical protein [Helicobacteraceae bacterium]
MSVTGNTASGATGDDKTDTALKLQVTYSNDASAGGLGWKFGDDKDNPWQVSPNKNGGYPHLYWQK